jgi:CRP/FNR family cyclic AMP-dependent transcriptional regulator
MLASHSFTRDEVALLGRLPFLAILPEAELAALTTGVRRRSYRRGEVIHHADDLAGDVFVIARGHVKHRQSAVDGRQLTHSIMGEGGFFGLMSVIDHKRRAGDAVALTDCEVLVIDHEAVLRVIDRHPEVSRVLLEHHVASLRRSMALVHDLAFLNVPARLAKTLLHYAEPEAGAEGESVVPAYLNQTELAFLVCTTRESINQWLQRFAREHWISVDHRAIRILNPEALRRTSG